MNTIESMQLESAVFRRLLDHLNVIRTDVQDIDLMIVTGFCRNRLAEWYREAAAARGIEMSEDEAREHVYGEPFSEWQAKYQKRITDEQLAALGIAQTKHGA